MTRESCPSTLSATCRALADLNSSGSYGEDIANIGSLQGHRPGRYLIRFARHSFGLLDGHPPTENDKGVRRGVDDDGYQGYINFPAAYGIMLGRIAAKPTAEDQLAVNTYQDQLRLTPVTRPSSAVVPALNLSLFTSAPHRVQGKVSTAHVVLRLTAALAPYNQSVVRHDRSWISDLLKQSGIYDGVSAETDLRHLHEYADSQASKLARSSDGYLAYGNGWGELYPSCKGDFRSCYQARYDIGKKGYLALSRDQALYPSLAHALLLGADDGIILRFSRKPVLIPTGFWSLTAYTAEQYLVPNVAKRYCLGDRDNLTYPDGTPLSDQSKDGEFCILLQPADIVPPLEWVNNWLPTPAGGGKLSITLRWYGATEAMRTAYTYPKMEYVSAIGNRAGFTKL